MTRVVKKNEDIEDFDRSKIKRAIRMAHLEAVGTVPRPEKDAKFDTIISHIEEDFSKRAIVTVDEIHDKVEKTLMYEEEFDTAKAYILYRDKKNNPATNVPSVILSEQEYTYDDLIEMIENIAGVSYSEDTLKEVINTLPRQATLNDFLSAVIYDMKTQFEYSPSYQYHAARVLLEQVYREVEEQGLNTLEDVINKGIEEELYDERMMSVYGSEGLEALEDALDGKRDDLFKFMGIQTLVDRYLIRSRDGKIIETPQVFWMRVAMGLALQEDNPVERAIEFYNVLSNFYGSSSTPTLFNSGTKNNQLASCFVPTVQDTIESIFDGYKEAAILAKYSGGLGVDFGGIRAMNSKIRGLGGAPSSGVIPFLKIMNDTMAGLMQGGKRRSNAAVYIEPWHPDIEDFLDLRNNTGDERRRTHDLNTALWIPDLFMERVHRDEDWWLISPSDAPELHETYGEEFKKCYEAREKQAESGVFTTARRVRAVSLWRKILSALFETGHPWLTWKDASNIRSPQDHEGVIHSSNLCCVASTNLVATNEGFMTVGEYYQSQEPKVITGTGGPTQASIMHNPLEMSPMVKVMTREGYEITVTPDHRMSVIGKGIVEAQDLVEGDMLELPSVEGVWGQNHNPELAFIAGLWQGDGTQGKQSIHIDVWEGKTSQFIPRIEKSLETLLDGEKVSTSSSRTPSFKDSKDSSGNVRARLTSAPLHRLFEREGVKDKSSVPSFVWKGDRETVAAYLEGLFAADGTIGKDTTQLSSISESFLKEIQIILSNFAIRSNIDLGRKGGATVLPDGRGGQREYKNLPCYRISITGRKNRETLHELTRLDEYRDYKREYKKGVYTTKNYATFTHLEPSEDAPAYCPTVESEDHLWMSNGLITHNTEITLNSSETETPVCNLASINLHRMTETGEINRPLLSATVKTLVRMLDNVIDLNFYPVEKAKTANMRHRPVGLGVMGFQDALWNLGTHASDPERTPLVAEVLMQRIAYDALFASSDLARERGAYESFKGSKWDRGILPHDTIDMLFATRSVDLQDKKVVPDLSDGWEMNYDLLRENISKYGMRNSNVLAIAPTATISNIQGVTQSVEPPFSNLFVKSNLSGKFTVVNEYLVEDLKELGLWDKDMLDMLKYHDGSVQSLPIPEHLKEKYRTAYEVPYEVLIESAARRQMWIDQAQSLNLYIEGTDGKKLSDMYMLAWKSGLKTTYYLRSRAATSVDKVSIDTNKFSLRQAGSKQTSAASKIDINALRNNILDSDSTPVVQSNTEVESDIPEDDWEEFLCQSCQ